MIAAIVLSGGKSERMGSPKALLALRDRTFIDNILDAIARSPVDQVVVVTGHHDREIREHLGACTHRIVFNPDYEQGMITSVQTGIRALPPDVEAALLFLADHPLVDPKTIAALVEHRGKNRIVLPVFNGRRGHPVLFASNVLDEIFKLPASQGANIVVRKDPSRVVEVRVEDPGILVDVDTPEDFEKLRKEL